MSRPLVIDAFPFHDELDILECRLTEIGDTVDRVVLVESDVTHRGRPKPYYYLENQERFKPWSRKIVAVQATGLPTVAENPDPWAREHAQREAIAVGLTKIGASSEDVVLQSDVDEIPRARQAQEVRPGEGLLVFGQRGHFWAIDWLYPDIWPGTVAGSVASIARLGARPFVRMRESRNTAACPSELRDAGWHLSWLGGPERALKKVGSFCHPEVETEIREGLDSDRFYREGIHVDGKRMAGVDVDDSWPKWIAAGNAPRTWYRPR